MTRAAGMYNSILQTDDPAIVVEVLNGYRIKKPMPENVGTFTVLGIPETLREGTDLTIVTYGALCSIALKASETRAHLGIDVELFDVQTLNPFDLRGSIAASVKKTNAVLSWTRTFLAGLRPL